MAEYRKPGRLLAVGNLLIRLLNRLGLSPQGAQTLAVVGRKTGRVISTPVNPLALDGERYLVAPRGDTHWARNLRAGGRAELRLGRCTEQISAVEVPIADRPPIISAYLKRWGNVTREHFGASSNTPGEEELARLAARTPVFRIERPK